MSLSNKIRMSVFVLALVAIMAAIWHFTFLGYVCGSNFCLLLAIATIAFGFDAIKYLEEYYGTRASKPKTKARKIAKVAIKVITLLVMCNTSAIFSALDVVIKHPTFMVEFATLLVWFVIYSVTMAEIDKIVAKFAAHIKGGLKHEEC